MSAVVHGVGVGPGDPELITLKAQRLLREVPVIAYPAPEQGESLARRIAAPHLPGGQIEIAIRMPLGDGQFPKADIYDAAATGILAHIAAGRSVAVLCEGDPFFYGSFIYLYERLAGRCELRVVPGVSSLMACAALTGRPLVLANQTLTVIPATLADADLRRRLAAAEAAAIVKLGRHLGRVRRVLADLGRTADAHYIERATHANQRAMPLAALTDDSGPYFSMIIMQRSGAARP